MAAFLAHPADLIIDAAGPDALRAVGPEALICASVWSVGAVAMAAPEFRARLASICQKSGHTLRLLACGMANMPLQARTLSVTMRGPEIEEIWTGPLSDAVTRWPDQLNTAVAVALNGPGLEATELRLEPSSPNAPREIEIRAEADGIAWHRNIRFDMTPEMPHPVAQMLLTELARTGRFWLGV
jgi:aspartate dehydrogenase